VECSGAAPAVVAATKPSEVALNDKDNDRNVVLKGLTIPVEVVVAVVLDREMTEYPPSTITKAWENEMQKQYAKIGPTSSKKSVQIRSKQIIFSPPNVPQNSLVAQGCADVVFRLCWSITCDKLRRSTLGHCHRHLFFSVPVSLTFLQQLSLPAIRFLVLPFDDMCHIRGL
jgi:hypothetical protein